MAHRATLHLGTVTGVNEYEILEFEDSFEQHLNLGPVHGIPMERVYTQLSDLFAWRTSGEVTGGVLKMTIATLPDSDTIFHRWMFSRWRPMSGTIRIEMNSVHNTAQELNIVFNNGYCTKLVDKFSSQNAEVMTTHIEITCQQITVGKNIPAVWPAFI